MKYEAKYRKWCTLILTPFPIFAFGPILTLGPILAVGSTWKSEIKFEKSCKLFVSALCSSRNNSLFYCIWLGSYNWNIVPYLSTWIDEYISDDLGSCHSQSSSISSTVETEIRTIRVENRTEIGTLYDTLGHRFRLFLWCIQDHPYHHRLSTRKCTKYYRTIANAPRHEWPHRIKL